MTPRFAISPPPQVNHRNQFTLKNLFLSLVLVTFFALLQKGGTPGCAVYFVIASLLALRSSEWAIKMVAVTLLIVVCNHAFVPKSPLLTPLRFGIWFLAAMRIGYDVLQRNRMNQAFGKPFYITLLLFCGVSMLLALIGGWYVQISALKLFTFLLAATVVLIGWEEASLKGSELTCWFYSIIIFAVLLGVLAYVTGQGYNAKFDARDVETFAGLFNGPFYHPQTLGPASAMMIVYLLCVVFYTPYPYQKLGYALIVVLLVFLYMTRSRTGVVALGIGVGAAVSCAFIFRRKGNLYVRLNVSKAKIVGFALLLLFGSFFAEVFSGGAITSRVSNLLTKTMGDDVGTGVSIDGILASREAQISKVVYHIAQRPLTGVGFGVDRSPAFVLNAGLFSAPTEKGFLPLAVVEENGIIGGFLFWLFIFLLYRKLIIDRNISGIGGLSALLGANLGEMMFFGVGGQGGFMWVILCACLALGPRCVTRTGPQGRVA